MEKITKFHPAFDKRDPDPNKDCGIHGVDLRMILKGELGAVEFSVFTNWHLPHVAKELRERMSSETYILYEPIPASLGFHSYKPIYENQKPTSEICEFLNNKPCYYDQSSLISERIFNILVEKGSDAVWEELEVIYNQQFVK